MVVWKVRGLGCGVHLRWVAFRLLVQDHRGEVVYVAPDTGKASYTHPLDRDYRALVRMMREAIKEDVTFNEVTMMATYLGMEPSNEPLLMWIARQAVLAPLPEGWEELQDGHGAYYRDRVSGEGGGGVEHVR